MRKVLVDQYNTYRQCYIHVPMADTMENKLLLSGSNGRELLVRLLG